MVGRHAVIAVNDIGMAFPRPLLAWVSLHPDKLAAWRLRRTGVGPAYTVSTTTLRRNCDADIITPDLWAGSSGLYAVQVALQVFRFRRVILCGVPILGSAGHIRGTPVWEYAEDYQRGWIKAYPFISSSVRSMSGWTRELLGSPSEVWLN